MNLNDVLNGLSEQQKQKLAGAKSKEELAAMLEADGVLLTDGQLDSVSGGECFQPFYCACNSCGWRGDAYSGTPCPLCGSKVGPADRNAVEMIYCANCGWPVPTSEAGNGFTCRNCKAYNEPTGSSAPDFYTPL